MNILNLRSLFAPTSPAPSSNHSARPAETLQAPIDRFESSDPEGSELKGNSWQAALTSNFTQSSTPQQQWEADKKNWTQEIRDVQGGDPMRKQQASKTPEGDYVGIKNYLAKPTWEAPRNDTSPYSQELKGEEQKLRSWLSSQKDVTPAKLLKKAIALCGNNPKDGAILAHNLTKNLANSERHQDKKQTKESNREDLALITHLANLRPSNSSNSDDKMGPWYHAFGIAAADKCLPMGGELSKALANSYEATLKTGNVDQEKQAIEQVMLDGVSGSNGSSWVTPLAQGAASIYRKLNSGSEPPGADGHPPPPKSGQAKGLK